MFDDDAKLTVLQNAVGSIPELRTVRTQAETAFAAMGSGRALTCEAHCELLFDAACELDLRHNRHSTRPRDLTRRVNAHTAMSFDDAFDVSHDIDTDIFDVIDVHEARQANSSDFSPFET